MPWRVALNRIEFLVLFNYAGKEVQYVLVSLVQD